MQIVKNILVFFPIASVTASSPRAEVHPLIFCVLLRFWKIRSAQGNELLTCNSLNILYWIYERKETYLGHEVISATLIDQSMGKKITVSSYCQVCIEYLRANSQWKYFLQTPKTIHFKNPIFAKQDVSESAINVKYTSPTP